MKQNFCIFRVKVIFVRANGERIEANGKVGDTLLDIVTNNEIDLDGFGKSFYYKYTYFLFSFFIPNKGKNLLKIDL